MEKKYKRIRKKGDYTFGDNYELIFRNTNKDYFLESCNIITGSNCNIHCGLYCNITCGNNCEIICGDRCKISCGNKCIITCSSSCYIKAGEGSKIHSYYSFLKTISKSEEFIWWCYYYNDILTSTFEDVDWKNKNPDMWNEFYGFVHNELDTATLF